MSGRARLRGERIEMKTRAVRWSDLRALGVTRREWQKIKRGVAPLPGYRRLWPVDAVAREAGFPEEMLRSVVKQEEHK